MSLINIEYGSLANSETMNQNFLYLDEKIADTAESIMTSISSILSNIATINSRLNDLSESMSDEAESLDSKIEGYRTKIKLLVKQSSIVPNWAGCVSINLAANTTYTALSNGYVLILPEPSSNITLTVNSKSVDFKVRENSNGNASVLIPVPVYKGDKLKSDVAVRAAYFLPSKEVTVEDF